MKATSKAKLHYLRVVLPLLVMLLLAACGDRIIVYKGTCAYQTRQFWTISILW